MTHLPSVFRMRPLALAIMAAAFHTSASAVPVIWVQSGDGFWDVATNWSSNPALPGAGDDVSIDVPSALRTITFRSGTNTVNSLTSQENFTLSGGSLTLNAASSVVRDFAMTSGTLGGAGNLTLGSAATLSGGVMTGAGHTILQGATSLSSLGLDNGRVLENQGTVTWNGGSVDLNAIANNGGSGRIDNIVGAVFDAQGNNSINATGFSDVNSLAGFPAFNNAGTFRKSVGVGATSISAAFNNTGAVDVQTGTLNLSGGGTSSGDFGGAGTLQFSGGTHTLSATSDITNANVQFSGGTVDHAGVYNVSGSTTVNGGTANLNGTVTSLGSSVNITSGTLNLASSAATVTTYSQSGGLLSGTGDLTVSGAATLSSGTMTGAARTILQGPTSIASIGIDNGRILENHGTVTWTNGSIDFNSVPNNGGSGRIDNVVGAVFDVQGSNSISATGFSDVNSLPGFPAFNNAGTFRRSVGVGATNISTAFNNTGTVDVQTGTLNLSGGGTSSGDFGGAGTLQFSGGTHTLSATSDITNANVQFSGGTVDHAGVYNVSGSTTVNAGTANLNGTVTSLGTTVTINGGTLNLGGTPFSLTSYNQNGGTLSGTGDLTVSGTATLSSGTMTGAARTILQGPTSIASIGIDNGRILENHSTVTWTNGSIDLNSVPNNGGSGRIDNLVGALFDAQGSNSISATGFSDVNSLPGFAVFNNAGTFRRSVGVGATNISTAFNNTGTVDVQTGTLNLSGGGTSSGDFGGAGTLQFSGGTHTLSATSDITNANVQFSGGTVDHAGVYNVSGSTTVSAGTANLNGTVTSLGTTLTINGGTLNLGGTPFSLTSYNQNGGTLSGTGDLTVSGTATLSSGTMTGAARTILQGPTSIASIGIDNGRILENHSTVTWTNGSIDLNSVPNNGGSGRIDNLVGALFDAQGSNSISATGFSDVNSLPGFAVFNNAGTFRRSVGVGTTNISTAFNNTGTVDVQTGTLNLSGGGTSSGDFGGAGTLQFGGGSHTLSATSDITNANVQFSGSTVDHAGVYNVSGSTTVSAGTANLNGTVTSLGSVVTVTGGTLNLSNSAASTTTYSQSGGVLAGAGDLTITGLATLSSGTMTGAGHTLLQGATSIGTFGVDNGRVLENHGTVTWTNGGLDLNSIPNNGGSGRIDNALGALFDAQNNNTISATGFSDLNSLAGFPAFNNAGTFRKSAGTGTTTINPVFNNTGAVQVQTGTLALTGGSTHSAASSITVNSGATLQFNGGTHTIADLAKLTSTGRVLVSSGTVDGAGALHNDGLLEITTGRFINANDGSTAQYSQSGGTFEGAGNLTITGAATLSGGAMTGSGHTLLQGATAIGTFGVDNGRVLENHATVTWANGNIDLNSIPNNGGSGRIDNALGALFDAQNNNTISATGFSDLNSLAGFPAFNNAGTFRKSAGTGTTTINPVFNNTGAVQVQTGTLALTGGSTHSAASSITVNSGATLQFNGGTHTIADLAKLTSTGRVLVSSGTVDGAGALHNDGLLEITTGRFINANDGSTAQYSQSGGTFEGAGNLTITGAATLSGGAMTGSGHTLLQGATTIGTFGVDNGRVLENHATVTWANGNIDLNSIPNNGGSGRIDNALGAVFDAQSGNTISATGFSDVNSLVGFPAFNNAGTFRKSASTGTTTIDTAFINSGLVQAAGNINFNRGISGPTGTLQIDAAGKVVLSAPSTVGTLLNNGNLIDALNLGNNTVTVSSDYNNANFGVGNAFNRRANVAVTGLGARILAAGDVNQEVSGPGVTSGNGAAPTMSIGNLHVGATTLSYGIKNAGTTGPSLRGAIQTSVNGANISDARLSGNGVSAGNWGAVAAGDTLGRDVVVNIATAGVYTPIVGQQVNILNNFDNTRSQLLTIASTAAAAAYNLAQAAPITPNPIALGNQHVGDTLSTALTISNSAPGGSFTEGLDAAFGASSGAALSNGGAVNLLAGQASDSSAMRLAIDTSTAGAKQGSVVVNLTSDGAGTSGLGLTALPSQTVDISGNVYRLASASAHTPEPIVFANKRIGDVASQTLSLTNTATNDGFSERLDASIGAVTGNATSNSGSFTLLNAGATNSASLSVGLDTSAAGHRTGTATISLASNGAGTSDLGVTALAAQTVNVSGDVFRLASASAHSPEPVTFGNRHVGASASQALSLTNTAANDGFSERLNASIGAVTGNATSNNGSFALLNAGATDGSSLAVGIDTSSAGHKSGTATISLASDGAGTSGFAALAIGSQTVNVSGDVYRLASASALTPNPIVFGNHHVGESAFQTLSVTNTATNDGFSEKLDAVFSGTSGDGVQQGSVSLLGAGQSNSSGLIVGINTGSAGHKVGTATVAFTSNGAGTSALGLSALGSQSVDVSGDVYRLASASTIAAVQFGNVHVGDVVSRALSLSNTAAADGFSENLDATFGSASDARILTSGSVSGLAAGATNNNGLVIGLDTSSAGSLTGFATVQFTSNGAGTSGLGLTSLGAQNVGVTTNVAVYRLADGAIGNTQPVNFGAHRVGDVVGAVDVAVRNVAANDGFSEALNASVGSVDSGFTASGSANLVAAGATNTGGIKVGLDTSTAGLKSGNTHLLYVSDGAGTSGLGQTSVGGENLALSGKVYGQAVAAVDTGNVDFGIVHVGDLVGPQAVTVRNVALGSLTDNLLGSVSAVPAGFSGAGSLGANGLAQGAASAALGIGLDTSSAGVFNGNATLAFASHNADMADLALVNGSVALHAQVNNFAHASMDKTGGDGAFTALPGAQFVFDFGHLTAGGTGVNGLLALTNFVTGPADTLGANFDINGGSFTLDQFTDFSGLGAGNGHTMSVSFNPLVAGLFEQVVRINLFGENGSGFHGSLGTFELTLRADVQAVPVPGAVWLLGSALAGLAGLSRRRKLS